MAVADGGASNRHGRPTLDDVAAVAGVSRNTVSLTLRGSRRVKAATAERVWAAVRAAGYHVNRAARTLASGRTWTLGVVHFDPGGYERTPYYYPIIAGIANGAIQRGYDTLLLAPRDTDDPDWLVEIGRSGRVDGLIFLGAQTDRPAIAALAGQGLPMVHVGRREIPGYTLPYVAPDASGGTAAATRHLIAVHGHRRIGFYAVDLALETHRDRFDGYRSAMAEAGLSVDAALVLTGRDWVEGLPAAALPSEMSALVISDGFGWGLVPRLQAAGRRVPEDVAVVVQDDGRVGGHHDPPLTGVGTPAAALGQGAARLVIEHIERLVEGAAGGSAGEGAGTESIVVEPELVIRRSCGCPFPA